MRNAGVEDHLISVPDEAAHIERRLHEVIRRGGDVWILYCKYLHCIAYAMYSMFSVIRATRPRFEFTPSSEQQTTTETHENSTKEIHFVHAIKSAQINLASSSAPSISRSTSANIETQDEKNRHQLRQRSNQVTSELAVVYIHHGRLAPLERHCAAANRITFNRAAKPVARGGEKLFQCQQHHEPRAMS